MCMYNGGNIVIGINICEVVNVHQFKNDWNIILNSFPRYTDVIMSRSNVGIVVVYVVVIAVVVVAVGIVEWLVV